MCNNNFPSLVAMGLGNQSRHIFFLLFFEVGGGGGGEGGRMYLLFCLFFVFRTFFFKKENMKAIITIRLAPVYLVVVFVKM